MCARTHSRRRRLRDAPYDGRAASGWQHRTLEEARQMSAPELAELTWEEVRDLDRARTVAILPVGAIEAHGPHLPLGTDVIIAQAMAGSGAARIAAQGKSVVILPSLPFSAAPFGAGF